MGSKLLVVLGLALLSPRLNAGEQLLSHPYSALPPSTAAVAGSAVLADGETLEYEIYWGIINVGHSFIRIENVVDIASRPVLHLVSEARSSAFINNFYKVNDRNESWMDAETLDSFGYYKKISEGKHFFNEWVIFDLPARRYFGQKMNRKREVSEFEGVLEKPVNDMLSAVYRVRAMQLQPGTTVEMDVNTKKNWRLAIKAGKVEKISTGYGKKKCLLVEPMVGEDGLFVAKAGKRMLIWVTQDELKLPMVLKAEISIGSITAKLVRRTLGKKP